ncbi:hypothetical protein BRC90_05425 [Halobacteriales archaeon QS_4_69_34]|nr:MAG: hypothetical protein BRC90_05425 [Halobacteriales archaeon QS_4_69_34]
MASSTGGGLGGFFAYYREYARSGVHAATAAALTALIGLASLVSRWFVVLAIAVYVLPPIFLYLTAEGERVPTVVGDGDHEDEKTADDHGHERTSGSDEDAGGGRDRTETGSDTSAADFDPDADGFTPAGGDTDGGVAGDTGSVSSEEASSPEGVPAATAVAGDASTDVTDDVDTDVNTDADVDTDVSVGGGADADGDGDSDADTDAVDPDDADAERGWVAADTPTTETLRDVVHTPEGAYAVGDGGVVLARGVDGWEAVLERGPTAASNHLRGVDATDDGRAVWFAGDSGALGRYDAESGRHTDHSAPNDETSTWTDVAIAGPAGEERIYLTDGSGAVLRGEYGRKSVEWDDSRKPGSGSSLSAVVFVDRDTGHLCDTNQCVYGTTDGGASYETIGIEDANTAFTAIAAADPETIVVAGADGSIFRYDGTVWTRLHVGEDALGAIDRTADGGLVAGDGGAVHEFVDGGWEPTETPVEAVLRGIVIGTDDAESSTAEDTGNAEDAGDTAGRAGGPDVAVGDAGTIVERW